MADENLELEEKQVKEYDDKLFDCLFTCEGGGAAVAKSSKLTVKKPGIRLHFSRFALFPNRTKESSSATKLVTCHQGQERENIEEVFPEGAPPVEGFFYAKTQLNPGYLYIIDGGDPNLCYEFEVDILGNLHPIYWAQNKDSDGNYKDIRRAVGQVLTSKVFKKNTVLWITFSPVQWSIDYHTIMRTNTQRRQKRMVKVECTGFERGTESSSNFITPFDRIHNAFFPEKKEQPIWFNSKLKEIIADDNSTLAKDPQSIKEDMFITLHDPIGNIKEACGKYSEEFLKFKALCEAIQTGETVDEAFDRIQNAYVFDTTKNKDHQYLFSLANFSYQHAFRNKEQMKKYSDAIRVDEIEEYLDESYLTTDTGYYSGREIKKSGTGLFDNGVDLQKIVGILGVDERKATKKDLIKLRHIVFDFFKSEYPFKNSEDYLHNTKIKTLAGRSDFYEMMEVLYVNPHDVDAKLNLPKNRETKDGIKDQFEQLIIDKKLPAEFKLTTKSEAPNFKGQNILLALSANLLNIEVPDRLSQELKEDISMKSAGIMKAGISVIASRAFSTMRTNSGTYMSISLNNKLSEVQREIVTQFNKGLLINSQELLALNEDGIILTFQDQYVSIYTDGRSTLNLDIISQKTGDYEVTFLEGRKLSPKQIRINKFNNALAKLINSNHFIACMGILATYNLLKSVVQLNENDILRNKANVLGSAWNVGEVALSINEKYAKLYKIPKLKDVLRVSAKESVENLTKRAGAIGGVLTCGICMMDSLELFAEDDYDSGVAILAAGVGFAISGIAPVYLGATLGGPVAWGILIVATGLYFLSEALKDDDFQKIYKHYLLSDYDTCNKNGESPMGYAQKILMQKEKLTHPNYRANRKELHKPNLESPRNANLLLIEKVVMPNIRAKGISKQSSADNILMGWYNSFTIAIPFNNYFNCNKDFENAEVAALFYPQHPKNYGNSRNDNISIVKKREGNVLRIKILIDRHAQYVSEKAFCDVFVRLSNIPGTEFFFPFNNEKGEQQIIKVRLKLHYNARAKNPIKGAYSIVPINQ